ncbi:PRTRC system protein D [Biomphalaria pfeifferi]|uniref:PRTRC system protein D n=1 Tax=Biomphalaria pfeifferi TaxID=112525 RepID=A0AAD8ET80_BIOPF|nr:PRTRC system protein D [Biomphalaria pfeifferi]
MEPVVRAIDVGFGNTKYVTGASGGKVSLASFPSLGVRSTDDDNAGVGSKRKTVMVPVGGFFYEVGPEIELGAQRHRSRHQHDGFTETDEYRALMAGALHYMKTDRWTSLSWGCL